MQTEIPALQPGPHDPSLRPAIIIPVYNHGRSIALVARNAQQLGLPVIVVDDGSTDSTAAELDTLQGIHVLRHNENQGKGAALLTGFRAADRMACTCAITLDGDGQHDPLDARNLLAAVEDGKRCIVIGRRQGMDHLVHVPWTSKFGRKFSNFWVWASGGPWLADSQSGFRLYPLPEVLGLDAVARRYQFEVEILVLARQRGIAIKEAPVKVIYQEKGKRISHFRPCLDFLRNSRTFSRLIWSRIFSLFRP
ncbi:MAG: glycosyltransferase family 2 protein [Desulforhopalus sp.]|nr:glycosyltransferase family 2 protein [Desulforhopalus sp.]